MGWELGVDKNFREAPQFFWMFTLLIAVSAAIILLPDAPLIAIMPREIGAIGARVNAQ